MAEIGTCEFTIVETTVSDKLGGLLPLLQAHCDELVTAKHLMELSPLVDAYRAMEQSGALLALVAYRGAEIAGYSINIIGPHLHYSKLRYAHNDALFVKREHRGRRLGLRLIHETENRAREKGARMMMWHAKAGTPLQKLLPRLDYAVQDVMFMKEI